MYLHTYIYYLQNLPTYYDKKKTSKLEKKRALWFKGSDMHVYQIYRSKGANNYRISRTKYHYSEA